MKTCKKCGESKPIAQFSKRARCSDGLQPWCKECNSIVTAKWRAANREKVKAYFAQLYAANPEKKKAATAAWQKANPERHRALQAKWKAENPVAYCIHEQNRRARKRAIGGKLSKGIAERLFKLQRGKCACGCRQPLGDDYHIDHIMPLALGGQNVDSNIQLLRKLCNLQKSKKHPVEFMQSRGFII